MNRLEVKIVFPYKANVKDREIRKKFTQLRDESKWKRLRIKRVRRRGVRARQREGEGMCVCVCMRVRDTQSKRVSFNHPRKPPKARSQCADNADGDRCESAAVIEGGKTQE